MAETIPGNISRTTNGFLQNPADWNRALAEQLAAAENITLTDAHWELIYLVRDYYEKHQAPPGTRMLVKTIRENFEREKGTSIYVMQLFSGSPAKLLCKIAGLPKPGNCD